MSPETRRAILNITFQIVNLVLGILVITLAILRFARVGQAQYYGEPGYNLDIVGIVLNIYVL
jgi:hypothetical protein